MAFYYREQNKILAQELRKNMTRQERHLWYDFLSSYPVPFRRQKQFGRYIVDFYCSQAKLIVELDGGQHFSPEEAEYDATRTKYLESLGLRVLRIPNAEIDEHFYAACEWINSHVEKRLGKEVVYQP